MTSTLRYPELGTYILPGHIFEPIDAVEEMKAADRLGLGSLWISERFAAKNADVLSGVATALAPSMGVASGLIQNLPLRHPIVTAGYGATMAKLSNNRFALGVGRGTDSFAVATGTPNITFRLLEDYITLLRRLWRGESVDYEGLLGKYSNLRLGMQLTTPPPIIMACMGQKTLKWAGRHCDGVILNSLWTPEAVARSALLVRQGAEEAGRDPSTVRIWTILVTACDVSEEAMLHYVVRRMNTYLLFPPLFDAICEGNGWARQDAVRLRTALQELDKDGPPSAMGDEATTRDIDKLRRMAELYPREWIEDGNAVGSGADGAKAVRARFDAGANSVLFHGCHPRDLVGVLAAWSKQRPAIAQNLPLNPGLV